LYVRTALVENGILIASHPHECTIRHVCRREFFVIIKKDLFRCEVFFAVFCLTLIFGIEYQKNATAKYSAFLAGARGEIRTLQDSLNRIKNLLRQYKVTHGDYPSTDDGLFILDSFPIRFGISVFPDTVESEPWFDLNMPFGKWEYFYLSKALQHKIHDSGGKLDAATLPKNTRGMGDLFKGAKYNPWKFRIEDGQEVEIGLTSGGEVFKLCPAGVMDDWYIPLIYENRRQGAQAGLLMDPTIDQDTDRLYTCEVDEGIYLFSVAGKWAWRRWVHEARMYWLWNAVHGTLLLGSLFLTIKTMPPRTWGWLMGSLVMWAIICGLFILPFLSRAVDYGWETHARYWSVLRNEYKETLAKYRDAGMIKAATYTRFVDSLDTDDEKQQKNANQEQSRGQP
jgi:hypothetical protein